MSTSTAPEAQIVAPNIRDLGELGAALSGWLADRMPAARDIRADDPKYPLGAGMSHGTIPFDAHWTEAGRPSDLGAGRLRRGSLEENLRARGDRS